MAINLTDLPEGARLKATAALLEQKKKYRNESATVNGIKFDSKKEARRFAELMIRLKAGEIKDLKLQETFTLQNGFTTPMGERIQAITYKADFTYTDKEGNRVIEDTKGMKTDVYKLKYKLAAEKGIHITEI